MKRKIKLLIIKNIRFSHVNLNGTNVPAKTLNHGTLFFPLQKVDVDFKYKHHWVSSPRDVKTARTTKVLISLTPLMNIE
jgi:hypothetical protein